MFGFLKRRLITRMKDAVAQVKLGFGLHLIVKYRQRFDLEIASALSAAVVNDLFGDRPAPYAVTNPAQVQASVAELRNESPELRRLLTDALRVYATLNYSEGTFNTSAVERAHALGILVPGGDAPDPTAFPAQAQAFCSEMLARTRSLD